MSSVCKKIGDNFANATEILGDRFTTAFTDDGKLYFVSLKGVKQSSINYFHETPLQGGHLISFDVNSKNWSEPINFPSISDDELLEGDIFGYGNHLFLLIYQKSKEFSFHSLSEWRENRWQKYELFEFDQKLKFDCGDRTQMKKIIDSSNGVYFLVERGRDLLIFYLKFSDDSKKAELKLDKEIVGVFPAQCHGGHIVRATIVNHEILYLLYGQQGCGFRWEPTRPIRIELNSGKIDHLVIDDETSGGRKSPPWAFSGAYSDYFMPPVQWFFLGGCRAKGLSSTEFDRSIWVLDVEKLAWKKFDACDLPDGTRFAGAIRNEKDGKTMFYAFNANQGVYEINPN